MTPCENALGNSWKEKLCFNRKEPQAERGLWWGSQLLWLVGERKMRQKTHFGREPENNNNYFFLKLEPYAKETTRFLIESISFLQSFNTCSLWKTTRSHSPLSSTRCRRAKASMNSATSASRRSTASTTPSAAPTQCTSRCSPRLCHQSKDNW